MLKMLEVAGAKPAPMATLSADQLARYPGIRGQLEIAVDEGAFSARPSSLRDQRSQVTTTERPPTAVT
jgi:hypothetical protein